MFAARCDRLFFLRVAATATRLTMNALSATVKA